MSRDWLGEALAGYRPTEADLRQLVVDCPQEDEYLDYKSGKLLADPRERATVVREYASAFGNAEGGTLLIGYDHGKHAFDGATPPGNATLEDWAASVLAEQGSFFAPPPRIATATVSGKAVLSIAFPRAPGLVPVVEARSLKYWVRLGSSNVRMPDHLVADLVLGRRRRPVLAVRLEMIKLDSSAASKDVVPNVESHLARCAVSIENVSLVPADDVRIGLATWRLSKDGIARPLPDSLLPSLDLIRPPEYEPSAQRLNWLPALVVSGREPPTTGAARIDKLYLGAYDLLASESLWPFALPLFPNHLAGAPADMAPELRRQLRGFVRLRAGLFVIARDAPPQWYQLTFDYETRPNGGLAARGGIVPAAGARPVVAVEFLPEDAE
jgi:hypothetical protein